jgi:hypothetical protein
MPSVRAAALREEMRLNPAYLPERVRAAAGMDDSPLPLPDLAFAHALFAARLHAVRLRPAGNGGYAVLWLDARVEDDIDAAWRRLPEQALWLHHVAECLCRTALCRLVPSMPDGRCAPLPFSSPELAVALRAVGLIAANACADCSSPANRANRANCAHCAEPPVLRRRYAILTHDPFSGGCAACALAGNCPKLSACVPPPDDPIGGEREQGTCFTCAKATHPV